MMDIPVQGDRRFAELLNPRYKKGLGYLEGHVLYRKSDSSVNENVCVPV